MDATRLAAELLEPIPAHRTFGIRVLRAVDGDAQVTLDAAPATANVIGSLHSSGLTALVDATGLAAIIAAAATPAEFEGVTPLGTLAELEFLAPARGTLTGHCALDAPALSSARGLLGGSEARARLITDVDVRDADEVTVCRGSFTWSLRRQPPAADPAV